MYEYVTVQSPMCTYSYGVCVQFTLFFIEHASVEPAIQVRLLDSHLVYTVDELRSGDAPVPSTGARRTRRAAAPAAQSLFVK